MVKRPQWVSWLLGLVSVFLIAISLVNLVGCAMVMNSPVKMGYLATNKLPAMLQLGVVVLGSLVTIVSAILIFQGRNNGRMLYLAWSIISLGIGVFNVHNVSALVSGSVISVVILIILFFPHMNRYFNDTETA